MRKLREFLDCEGPCFWALIGVLSFASLTSIALLIWVIATEAH